MSSRSSRASYLRSALIVSAAALAAAIGLAAQERVDSSINAKIREEGLQRSQAPAIFNHLTNIIGPRLTASPAFKTSVDWTRQWLEQKGVGKVTVEPWEFGRGWALERFSVEMLEPRYMPLLGYPSAWSPSTAGRIVAQPVWLGDLRTDQVSARAGTLAGAIVMRRPVQMTFERKDRPAPVSDPPGAQPPPMSEPPPVAQPDRTLTQAMQNLLQKEKVGVILDPSRGEHGTVFVTGRDAGAAAMPTVVLAGEHYNLVARLLQQNVKVTLAVDMQTRFYEQDRNAYNVIVEIPGVDPKIGDEVVMVGAHLDSWHTAAGATDNADGVTTVMEAMRILKTIGVRPRRTIRGALWGGEEQGLLGSKAWVARHLAGDANRGAREKLSVYFNLDNGIAPISGFFLENNAGMRPLMEAWLEPFKDLVKPVITLQKIGATDHLSFIDVGVPGFQAVQDFTNYDVRTHHTNMDAFDRVEASALQSSAVIMASVLYHAAMRDERIPRGGS